MSRRRKKTAGNPQRTRPLPAPPPAAADRHGPGPGPGLSAPPAPVGAPPPTLVTAQQPTGFLAAVVERIGPSVVGVTVAVEPPAHPPVQDLTIRLRGRQVGADGSAGDGEFGYEETLHGVLAGAGPLSVTAKVTGVAAGTWSVTADATLADGARGAGTPVPARVVGWSWRRWRLVEVSGDAVRTGPAPLVASPAVLLGSWLAMVLAGMALALLTQALLVADLQLGVNRVLPASGLALVVGAIGAKVWYVVLHRRDGRADGWAVQGLVAGIALGAPVLLWAWGARVGAALDATAPGLMFGLATGRIGCFLTGCCAGRPTCSRWGVWSSNRRVGRRRIPTQLLESTTAVLIGAAALVGVLLAGTDHGELFAAVVAGFTLLRQLLLRLREEPRRSRTGPVTVAAAAAVVLAAALVSLAAG